VLSVSRSVVSFSTFYLNVKMTPTNSRFTNETANTLYYQPTCSNGLTSLTRNSEASPTSRSHVILSKLPRRSRCLTPRPPDRAARSTNKQLHDSTMKLRNTILAALFVLSISAAPAPPTGSVETIPAVVARGSSWKKEDCDPCRRCELFLACIDTCPRVKRFQQP
jgi:hypothetical protein